MFEPTKLGAQVMIVLRQVSAVDLTAVAYPRGFDAVFEQLVPEVWEIYAKGNRQRHGAPGSRIDFQQDELIAVPSLAEFKHCETGILQSAQDFIAGFL
jgi:hypothetical protein